MKDEFLKVVKYLAEHGELIKAYHYLVNPPSIIDNDNDVLNYLAEIKKRLDDLAEIQTYGTVGGKFNAGFVDPEDVSSLVGFQHLRKKLIELDLKKVLDVGCYTGWMGRALSEDGIAVHGIDIHPIIIQMAAYAAVGTRATFQFLSGQKVGFVYPKKFDAVVMFDVLEHCFYPNALIKSINKAVRDGGWVFINLPHPEAEHISNDKPLNKHEHLYSFSEKRLNDLFGKYKNFKLEVLNNEQGNINWFVEYQL